MWLSDQDWWRCVGALVLAGVALGFVLFEGLPWLWEAAKPLLRVLVAA